MRGFFFSPWANDIYLKGISHPNRKRSDLILVGSLGGSDAVAAKPPRTKPRQARSRVLHKSARPA